MNTAHKGRRQEHRSIRIYKAQGFECIRAAGSKGAWDFIAISGHTIVLVQVRSGKWPPPAERRRLGAFLAPLNCQRELHRWRPRARTPDVKVWNGTTWRDDTSPIFGNR